VQRYSERALAEPSTILYQVWSLIVTLENATQPGSAIPIEAAQTRVVNLVNTFFRDKLDGMPSIKEYIDTMQAESHAS
jgi:hypothetical protein